MLRSLVAAQATHQAGRLAPINGLALAFLVDLPQQSGQQPIAHADVLDHMVTASACMR